MPLPLPPSASRHNFTGSNVIYPKRCIYPQFSRHYNTGRSHILRIILLKMPPPPFLLIIVLLLIGILIKFEKSHSLLSCPVQCICSMKNGQSALCRSAGLEQLPQNLPENVKNLNLANNNLTNLTNTSFQHLKNLHELNLQNNRIESIESGSISNLNHLSILLLKRNRLKTIPDALFINSSTTLRILELDDNFFVEIPTALRIQSLINLEELSLASNRIHYIPFGFLQNFPNLHFLNLKGNPIRSFASNAFTFLVKLRTLILSDTKGLNSIPNFNGTNALEKLRLDRGNITNVTEQLCITCPKLKTLDLKSNKLTVSPHLIHCDQLRSLDLTNNHIQLLIGKGFSGLYQMQDLILAHNLIQAIPQNAFYNLSKLQILNLQHNKIAIIHQDAFVSTPLLVDLNLAHNIFSTLPTAGLGHLLHLKTFNNPNLREFPSPTEFPQIQTLLLAYAYHCCSFMALITSSPHNYNNKAKDLVVFPDIDDDIDLDIWKNDSSFDLWPLHQNISHKLGKKFETIWGSIGVTDVMYPMNFPTYVMDDVNDDEIVKKYVKCLPLPGPFLPCQDLFDWWTLRCGVWVVFLCALLGNGTVVFVLIFSRGKFDVPRFLVCNLAIADFCMGLYLGVLAIVDASTLGQFRMYAIPWQMSIGCQICGFLSVFSSELSVYTLAVITLERNYAITHAMHLNKRLSLKHATYIMICGWGFAISMALLPLFHISDYRKFAICLPFEISDSASLTYIVFLMCINGVAFSILMGCYLKMYCAIRGSQAWNSNDSRIAKRMALLVFTDFLCWSPIAFFALTATFGLHLITLEQAKVFTVFVLPLNSCCNPFLYAILTKQFKKDCVMICKTIEESRVTRGIGRCKHSSNFSNRQTPQNTNSLTTSSRDTPVNYHTTCTCNNTVTKPVTIQKTRWDTIKTWICGKKSEETGINQQNYYTYQIAEIQQKQNQRASSLSSSSSRSDSWHHRHHAIPLRLLDVKKCGTNNVASGSRKPSQDSNLSSSRNDSSGSASTTTWKLSRSSGSNDSKGGSRLVRQPDDPVETTSLISPTKLTVVRFLSTIPSLTESSTHIMEEQEPIIVENRRQSTGTIYPVGKESSQHNV